MSNKQSRKSCVVPKCSSTTINTPEKLFFSVPFDPMTRKMWMQVMKRTYPPAAKSCVYCCEDHFDIESDMDNYIRFKLVGGQRKLKKGVLPHKFECQEATSTKLLDKKPESNNSEEEDSKAIPKIEIDLPIKIEMDVDSDGEVPLSRMVSRVPKTEPAEEHIWEVPITRVDVKCEYEVDPEYDDELRRVSLEHRQLPLDPDIEEGVPPDQKAGAAKSGVAADNPGDEKHEAREVPPRTRHTRSQCSVCHKYFHSISYLKQHLRTHTGEKPYKCTVCHKCFSASGRLKEHLRTHTGEKPYGCTHCEKRFTTRQSLKMHLRSHNGEKPYECSICKKRFVRRDNLTAHTMKHAGVGRYQCDICSRLFVQRPNFEKHLKIHTAEKQFECSICKKRFVQKHGLQTHFRTHTGEKPFECNICLRRFILKTSLRKHSVIHTGEKPHKCGVCQKCFAHVSTLQNHLSLHSGEKPHRCSVCGKQFARKTYLRSHLRRHAARR